MATREKLTELSRELVSLQQEITSALVTVRGRRGPSSSGVRYDEELILAVEERVTRERQVDVELEGQTVMASVVGRDPGSGLALLRLDEPVPLEAPNWAPEVQPGLVMLAALDDGGLKAQLLFYPGGRPRLPGLAHFAGGVAANMEGELMAFCSQADGPVALSRSRLDAKVAALLEGDLPAPGFLGLALHPTDHQQGPAVLVLRVEPGSPAEQAGVIVGDLLTRVGEVAVDRVEEVFQAVRDREVGSRLGLELLRGGQPLAVEVVLGERPQKSDTPPTHRGRPGHHVRRKIRKVVRHLVMGEHGPPGPGPTI